MVKMVGLNKDWVEQLADNVISTLIKYMNQDQIRKLKPFIYIVRIV